MDNDFVCRICGWSLHKAQGQGPRPVGSSMICKVWSEIANADGLNKLPHGHLSAQGLDVFSCDCASMSLEFDSLIKLCYTDFHKV